MALFLPKSDWVAPKVSDLPTWPKYGRVALDIESRDPNLRKMGPGFLRDAYVIGVAFAIDGGPAYYLPVRHEGGGNVHNPEQVWAYLSDQLTEFEGEIVGANIQYDIFGLQEAGIRFNDNITYRDVLIADPLICELHNSYSLKAVGGRWGVHSKQEELLDWAAAEMSICPKSEMYKLHAKYVGEYATNDVTSPLEILRLQEAEIERQNLHQVWELETKLLPVLVKMRKRGVRVDLDQLDRVDALATEQQKQAIDRVRRLTGRAVSPFNSASILAALDAAGVDMDSLPRTATGKPSTAKDVLAGLGHPVADSILEARKAAKMRTAFVEGIRNAQVNGRIHSSFQQMRVQRDDGTLFGAAFGRLSSASPNLQQVPKRGDLGKMMRSVFVADEGEEWASIDYSAQEPRMISHYAITLKCEGWRDLETAYRNDPELDLHQRTADQAKIDRNTAKVVYLARAYGAGGGKICDTLGLPTEMRHSPGFGDYRAAGPEGQEILDRFDAGNGYLKQLAKKCQAFAEKHGYIRTILGRKCRFPKEGRGFGFTYKALNRLAQGSAADQMKQAIVNADSAGYSLQLVVHDELCVSVPSRETAEGIAKCMVDAVTLRVPTIAEPELGSSWGG